MTHLFVRRSVGAAWLSCALAGLAASAAVAAGPSKPSNPGDVAGVIAFLQPVQRGACPGVSFDPFAMSKLIDPQGMSLDTVKRRFKKNFDESFTKANEQIASEGKSAYCELIRGFFGSAAPGEFPGLAFR